MIFKDIKIPILLNKLILKRKKETKETTQTLMTLNLTKRYSKENRI
jgi:hypothetical protein